MKRILLVLSAMLVLVAFGTVGYMFIEQWSAADGFFMTVITMSTVGYGETNTLTPEGRTFTAVLIFLCIVAMTHWTAALTSFVVERELSGLYRRRRILKMIANLKDHVIICGSDAMTTVLIDRLIRRRVPVVLIEEDEEKIKEVKRRFRKIIILQGNPTNELTLAEANVLQAKSVVVAMDSEVDNLLVGITCKDIGEEVAVYARSNDPVLGNRMRKSGIDQVISPSQLCGDHIAGLIPA